MSGGRGRAVRRDGTPAACAGAAEHRACSTAPWPPRGPAPFPPAPRSLEVATPPTSRRSLLLLLPLLAAACGGPHWTQGQLDEAYRLCRAEIGFPPISVFESTGAGFATFMCRCEVEYLSERVPQAEFRSGLYLDKVNRVLFAGRTACMSRHRDGAR